MTIRQSLENLVGTDAVSDPHGNIRQYMAVVENSTEEMDKLAGLLERFVADRLSSEQHERLYSQNSSDTEKLEILTRLAMDIPFDYLGNAIKTAEVMRSGNLPALDQTLSEKGGFHYLRTPREVLEGYFENGTGGDCFSTSSLTQILFSVHGIESKMALCYDKKEDSDKPEKRHHCVVLAKADGKEFYIDTSLNVEVPAEYGSGKHDLGNKSSVFRLNLEESGEHHKVGFMPIADLEKQGIYHYQRTLKRNEEKGPVHLWYFKKDGNPLSEIVPSMLYTLHPEVPASGRNRFNRNQQMRASKLNSNGNGELVRDRIYLNETTLSYFSKPIINGVQIPPGDDLSIFQNGKTGLIEQDGASRLADYMKKTFGVKPEIVHQAVESLNYVNSSVRK
jgi:hypothetical protein